ncbi:MAG TPA: phosphoenolpyruvate carboxykinase (ATP) [Phycisphaerales bacterium]|nr:phosphoenolpyruvate carboxykinase (ATP) [Phycisphaerales bacterium]
MPTLAKPTTTPTAAAGHKINLTGDRVHRNVAPARLVELALARGEGVLASNGGLVCLTGDRTGRSPKDKYLEDTAPIHDKIGWGGFNTPITPANFDVLLGIATEHMNSLKDLFVFEGFVGADPSHRLCARVISEQAWHALFIRTLFIPTDSPAAGKSPVWKAEGGWTIINAGKRRLTADEQAGLGVKSPVMIAQSLTRKMVVIVGSEYAGEMKKSLFYAMNFDMPEAGVFPMHCSANVDKKDPANVALFFGLSGTGKTTLSADPNRALIGDDEHGWSDRGVFNFEGGCYAKCIKLSKEGEPQIWNAVRFGSVLENLDIDPVTRIPDYDSTKYTENTRATYPIDFIPDAIIPSIAGHPRNVIFLTSDAYGVMPPVSKLSREQAMYYFINGYTAKLAGTELGVTEPQPNFSACFGSPFLPRPPKVYAEMLAAKVAEHNADVWLLNTGWTGGPYGVGSRFKLAYTRAFVNAILNGTLRGARFTPDPVFGLPIPSEVAGVPSEVLNPRNTWKDGAAYDAKAKELAARFRANDQKFEMPAAVRGAGPKV